MENICLDLLGNYIIERRAEVNGESEARWVEWPALQDAVCSWTQIKQVCVTSQLQKPFSNPHTCLWLL